MKKYLIVKCDALGDQFECDANRTPLCLTDNCSTYGYGYEVYELQADGTFELIKEYETPLEEGIAVYYWTEEQSEEELPTIVAKFPNVSRYDKEKLRTILNIADKKERKEALADIGSVGAYGKELKNGNWFVVGEYMDNIFACGY